MCFLYFFFRFNEFARQATGEGGKAANTRALLFDISFLMLCHIAQLYGAEVIIFVILISLYLPLYMMHSCLKHTHTSILHVYLGMGGTSLI